jgi:hypothetical protein
VTFRENTVFLEYVGFEVPVVSEGSMGFGGKAVFHKPVTIWVKPVISEEGLSHREIRAMWME